MRDTKLETLAIIPARGGSKGINRKNLQEVNGVSLVGMAIRFAMSTRLFDAVHLSTDSEEIAKEGEKYGCRPRFMRSAETSGDRASATEVIREIRTRLLDEGTSVQRYVLLEPTSPMREARFVSQAIDLTRQKYDAALTVSPVDLKYHPDKQFRVSQQGDAEFFTANGPSVVARQELVPTYIRNGFCYVVNEQAIADGWSILGSRLGAVLCDVPYVNIDSPEDLNRCRRMMARRDNRGQS